MIFPSWALMTVTNLLYLVLLSVTLMPTLKPPGLAGRGGPPLGVARRALGTGGPRYSSPHRHHSIRPRFRLPVGLPGASLQLGHPSRERAGPGACQLCAPQGAGDAGESGADHVRGGGAGGGGLHRAR